MLPKRQLLTLILISHSIPAMDLTSEDRQALFLRDVYDNAPIQAKNIVPHLQDPEFLNEPNYRASFFVGMPGVGKTTLAQAIGQKLVQVAWLYHFFSCADFQGKHRGEISEKLKGMLDSLPTAEKNLVVIDEINQLFEHADNDHYDTNATSKTLWTFLDSQNGNNNFFLIGTMNRSEYAPQQIKSRLLGQTIRLDELTQDKKLVLLRYMFSLRNNTVLHQACTDNFFKTACAEYLKTATRRDLDKFVGYCSQIFRERDTASRLRTITTEDIIKAQKQLRKEKTDAQWNWQSETNEQRQERLHEEAFVKQLWLQINTIPGLSACDLHFKFFSRLLLSDTQLAYYKTLEAREAVRKQQEKEKEEELEKARKAANKWW